jgi:hypothetical protein
LIVESRSGVGPIVARMHVPKRMIAEREIGEKQAPELLSF